MTKGAQTPPAIASALKSPGRRLRKCEITFTDSLLESRPFSMMVWNRKCSRGKDKWGKLPGPP